jgi:hypothetical protein
MTGEQQGKLLFVYDTGHGLEINHPAYLLWGQADPSRLHEMLFWFGVHADGRQHPFGSLINYPLNAPHVQEFLRKNPPDARWLLKGYQKGRKAKEAAT